MEGKSKNDNPYFIPCITSTPMKRKISKKHVSHSDSFNHSKVVIDAVLKDHKISAQKELKQNYKKLLCNVDTSSSDDEDFNSNNKLKLIVNPSTSRRNIQLEKSEISQENFELNFTTKRKNSFLKKSKNERSLTEIQNNMLDSETLNKKNVEVVAKKRTKTVDSDQIIFSNADNNNGNKNCLSLNNKKNDVSSDRNKYFVKQKLIENYITKSKNSIRECNKTQPSKKIGKCNMREIKVKKVTKKENIASKFTHNSQPNTNDEKLKLENKNKSNLNISSNQDKTSSIDIVKKSKVSHNVDKEEIFKSPKSNINQKNVTNNFAKTLQDSDKKNSSHQLFSDSKEQELFNSLNFNTSGNSEEKNNGKKEDSLMINIDHKKEIESVEKTRKNNILHIKKNCKVQENLFQLSNPEIKTKKGEFIPLTNGISLENISEKNKIAENVVIMPEANNCNDRILLETNRNERENLNKLKTFKNLNGKIIESENKELNSSKQINNDVNIKKKLLLPEFFKRYDQISSFEEFKPGCFILQNAVLKGFKCGLLKINPDCHHSSKTMHKNSYLGGVIIKGSLNLKIDEVETESQEGDMIFVPPLTCWTATNRQKNESVMYYWCGKF